MVFMSDKGSGSGDMTMRRCTTESESQLKKTCVDCGTSKTPLWRSGPDGPKSLCNACGIKSRKKRRPTASDKCSKEHKKPKNEIANLNSKSIAKDECNSSEKEEYKRSEEEEGKSVDTEKEECKSTDREDTEKNEMEIMVKRIKMVLNGDAPRGGGSNDEADSSCCDFGEEERAAIQLMALSYGILSS